MWENRLGGFLMKKFISGMIFGMAVMVSVTTFAQEGISRVSALINPNVKVVVNDQTIKLEEPVLVRDGRTYLPLRFMVENVMGANVEWSGATQTAKISMKDGENLGIQETMYEGLNAVIHNGITYFDLRDYSEKYNPIGYGYDSEKREIFLCRKVSTTSAAIEKEYFRFSRDEANAVFIHNGKTHVNVKYYRNPDNLK